MPDGIHQFKVGSFRLLAINDEATRADDWDDISEWEFVNASPAEVQQVFDAHRVGPDRWRGGSTCNCLLIDTGRNRVLVDTGCGKAELSEKGLLLSRLAEAGVAPETIDTVVLTHGHWDHIGANADTDGHPIFRNARYLMTETEFRHWTEIPSPFGEEIDDQGRTYADDNLVQMRERIEFVAADAQIVPGIDAVSTPGHTPDQIALLIQDGVDRLLCVADVFHYQCELVEPDWYFDFDHDPGLTVVTRRQILDWAANENLLVHAYHLPFPGLGRIVADGDHWEWVRP